MKKKSSLPQKSSDDAFPQTPYPVPAAVSAKSSLADILAWTRQQRASDVHITPNNPVFLRKFSYLTPATSDGVLVKQIQEMLENEIPPEQLEEFQKRGDLEFVHTVKGSGRYRMILTRQRFGIDISARVIADRIMTFEETGMPKSCEALTHWAQGLVLVTGPSGCGKTTTLTALVEMMNQTREDHIITIEDPIEYIYQQKKCQITQREIGKHTLSQANALRAALREDPDIIVVSELRDLESIQLAVTAAETGHLVLGTMNTNDAAQTVSKLIFSFPADERSVITNMISESLRGVITQQLIPKADKTGVVSAFEVLIVNAAISNLIRENKFQQINNAIAVGKSAGMQLLDNSLQALVTQGSIDGVQAYRRAINPRMFEQYAPKGGTLGKN